MEVTANGVATPTVSDSAGNTYTVDVKNPNGTATTVYLCSAMNVFTLAAGATITVTFDTARTLICMRAAEWGGLKNVDTDPGDGFSVGSANTATALACGAITTKLGNDLVYTVFGYTSDGSAPPTFTPGSGYTAIGQVNAASGGSSRVQESEYKILAAPTTITPSATLGSAKSYTGVTWVYAAIDPGTAALPSDPSDPVAIGTGTVTSSSTTCTITTTATAPAGSSISVLVTANGAVTATVADSASNTYVQDINGAYSTASTAYIITAHNISVLNSGQTITITFSSARTTVTAQAYYITGIASGNNGVSVTTGTTSSMVGQSITPTTDKCLVVGLFGMASDNSTLTFTAGTGWTAMAYTKAGASSASRDEFSVFRHASTSAVTPSATCSAAKNYAAVAVAYVPGTGGTSQTGTYSTIATAQSAINSAIPGDVITLASGTTFNGKLVISNLHGTAATPITVIGGNATTSIVDAGTTSSGYVVQVDLSSYLILKNFKVQNGQKAVMVERSNNITLDGITATLIGQEAIHFRNECYDCTAKNCTVSYTGQTDAGFGEAFYLGTAVSNWGVTTTRKPAAAVGYPDLTKRITIGPNNTAGPHVTAECVDIKEGTLNNFITGNNWDGTDIQGANSATSLLSIKGSGNVIDGDTGTHVNADGYRTVTVSGIPSQFLSTYTNWDGTTQPGVVLCSNNEFKNLTLTGAPATGYGVNIVNGSGNVVRTSVSATSFGAGTSNIALTP
ncbi:hypothetical protein [Frankia sp. Cj3]|uniref:hypothetical protein n=1 Tax=Frankia sp. Cj3 TaxID=2880976 RepID=UPI001EF6898D|nr:hypothetical protein [Frankia sp. Cj3]